MKHRLGESGAVNQPQPRYECGRDDLFIAPGVVRPPELHAYPSPRRPVRVCALGELAYCALRALQPDLDPKARPTEGRRFDLSVDGISAPLLYTSFPSSSPVRGRQLRDFTRGHLEEFLA